MHTFDFIPTDTLFCRDGRPLAAGSSFGRGAHFPLPPLLHAAVRTALLQQADCLPCNKSERGSPRPGSHKMHEKRIGTKAFQWLNIRGPFPVKEGKIFAPLPRDLVVSSPKNGAPAYLRLKPNGKGLNNLPRMLHYVAVSESQPSKKELPGWVDFSFIQSYLSGENPLPCPPAPRLWSSEYRIGVELDDATHTAADGKLYAAEHLRLRDGVCLRFSVSPPPIHKPSFEVERNITVSNLGGATLQLGGERRFGQLKEVGATLDLPSVAVEGTLIKWLLLTPAVFSHGWRPGWIDEDGKVKLRRIDKEERRRFRRKRREGNWRYNESDDTAEPIDARLVAAVTGKPLPISGWDPLHSGTDGLDQNAPATGGGKPTLLAVPAGSVYYFEARSESAAKNLAEALQGRCRSDFYGEKGLGLGVCGKWKHQALTSGDIQGCPGN